MPAHGRRRNSSSQLSRALERERLTFEAIERVICRKSSGEITGLAQLGVWGGVNCPMERRVRFPGCLASAMLDQRRSVSEGDSRRDHRAHGRRARQLLGGARHDPSASAREEQAGRDVRVHQVRGVGARLQRPERDARPAHAQHRHRGSSPGSRVPSLEIANVEAGLPGDQRPGCSGLAATDGIAAHLVAHLTRDAETHGAAGGLGDQVSDLGRVREFSCTDVEAPIGPSFIDMGLTIKTARRQARLAPRRSASSGAVMGVRSASYSAARLLSVAPSRPCADNRNSGCDRILITHTYTGSIDVNARVARMALAPQVIGT